MLMLSSASRWIVAAVVALAACAPPKDSAAPIGAPLPDLSVAETARFRAGEVLFNHVFTAAEGVGPLFNENQCSACHTAPVTGGTGDQLVAKASHFQAPDRCDALSAQGGENVRSRATPLLQAAGFARQAFPIGATERTRFTVPFLFGLGLVEAIPEDKILAHADPSDEDKDGISGRPGRTTDGKLGRFGRKAEFATVRDFSENALHLEMGLTTARNPSEGSMGAAPFPAGVDPARDPEVSDSAVSAIVDFVRFLAPPARRPRATQEEGQSAQRGEEQFHRAGCDRCHVPSFITSRAQSRALSRRRVFLYSDLLLHEMGPALANVCTANAIPSELRTAPLMGVGQRKFFLHDGRAKTLQDAILLHGGEAELARQRFRGLNEVEQNRLLDFLRTL
jgi:CxxC motif-containing protein (DUF1111 family)